MSQATSASEGPAPASVKIPLRLRLKAWWNGHEIRVKESDAAATPAFGRGSAEADPFLRWSEPHLRIAQAIWGPGMIGSTSPQEIRDLAAMGRDAAVKHLVDYATIDVSHLPEPDLDPDELDVKRKLVLSSPVERALRLRWLALISGRLPCSLNWASSSLLLGLRCGRATASQRPRP